MKARRVPARLSGLAATVLVAFLQAAAPAVAEPARTLGLVYDGYLGAAPVVRLSIDLALPPADRREPERYRAAAAIEAAAALRDLLPFRLTARADGAAAQGRVRPRLYSSLAALGSMRERALLTYGPDGAVSVRLDPARGTGRDPAVAAGGPTLDPLSAAVAAVLAVARDGVCRGRFPVFDGVRRYDLSLAPVGPAVLARSRFSLHAGPAMECALRIAYRDGFRPADLRAGLYPETVRVWFAPVIEGAPPLPVRFAARSALGALQLDLVEARAVPASPPS